MKCAQSLSLQADEWTDGRRVKYSNTPKTIRHTDVYELNFPHQDKQLQITKQPSILTRYHQPTSTTSKYQSFTVSTVHRNTQPKHIQPTDSFLIIRLAGRQQRTKDKIFVISVTHGSEDVDRGIVGCDARNHLKGYAETQTKNHNRKPRTLTGEHTHIVSKDVSKKSSLDQ
jgi:hypothetical protein